MYHYKHLEIPNDVQRFNDVSYNVDNVDMNYSMLITESAKQHRFKHPNLLLPSSSNSIQTEINEAPFNDNVSRINSRKSEFKASDIPAILHSVDSIVNAHRHGRTWMNDEVITQEAPPISNLSFNVKNHELYNNLNVPNVYDHTTIGISTNALNQAIHSKPNIQTSSNVTTKGTKQIFSKKESYNTSRARTNTTLEQFSNPIVEDADYMYMNILKSRAKMVCEHVSTNKFYSKWSENWKLLRHNLSRNKYLFKRLEDSDADIAYVINKGDEVKFRIRDQKRYVPVNIYQYVLYHEMAHMSTTELQHTPKFHELLNILTLAAFELGLIDLKRTTKEFYTTNGQPILCRAALQDEIVLGCDWLKKANPGHKLFFENIADAVDSV